MNEYISRVKFKDIFENYNVFDAEFELSGFKDATNLTAANAQIMFNVLYAKYCNSTLATIDSLRFKAQFFSMIFQYAPAWQKKLAIQNIIYAMDEDDVTILNENVFNSAQNPSTAPSTDAFTPLSKIDTQNATRTKRNALSGWAQLRDLVESDFTNEFVKKFQRLFIVIIEEPCDYPPILKIRGNKIYAGEVLPGIGYPYEHGDIFIDTLTKKIYQYDSVYGEPQWAFIVDVSASISPELLIDTLEGSEYISVDMNEAGDKVIVELDETKLETDEATEDSDKLITSGAVFNGLGDKQDKLSETQISNINRALVSPVATSTEKRIVALDEQNNQVELRVGNGLSINGLTSPFTLEAQGGGGGESKLVEVTYGVTTYQELVAIINEHKIPYVMRNYTPYIGRRMTDQALFGFFANNYDRSSGYLGITTIYVNASSQWSEVPITELERLANKKSTIDPTSTTEYPSSKAVADYVAQHSGGWTLIWENASPSSSFASQTLSINSTNYNKIVIVTTTNNVIICDKTTMSLASKLIDITTDDGDSVDINIRKITNIGDTQIVINDCRHTIIDADSISSNTRNNYMKPNKIYGFN